jgi:hypothetical protein
MAEFDLVIRGGTVVDVPVRRPAADVAAGGDRIAAITPSAVPAPAKSTPPIASSRPASRHHTISTPRCAGTRSPEQLLLVSPASYGQLRRHIRPVQAGRP